MGPRISIMVEGERVPLDSLPEEKQLEIRKRFSAILQDTIERQIKIMIDRQKTAK